MKKCIILIVILGFLMLTGCGDGVTPGPQPNLVVQDVSINNSSITFVEKNIGDADAGSHLTYVEISLATEDVSKDPQCQFTINVPAIAAGSGWTSDPIPLRTDTFSCPAGRGPLDLNHYADFPPGSLRLVIRADAKMEVIESDETDNISTTIF